jgi:hypothetical protein
MANIGDVVYQVGTYVERVILQSGNTDLVECAGGGYLPLYRLEWRDEGGNYHHSATRDYAVAVANFEQRQVKNVP